LQLWTHGGEQVVRVHDNVYGSVEQSEEGAVAARCEFDTEPNGHWHATVMDDVQCGHLTRFLSQHEEDLYKKETKISL
jgi:hypothetical protein